jgi:redox-sensitive bicupin YhaK (pirin superfamily)
MVAVLPIGNKGDSMTVDTNKTQDTAANRRIIHRTRGKAHGRITRLVSPSELGETIKPFVFLDAFGGPVNSGSGFGWHPHSGIATLSLLLEGRGWIEETSGERHELQADGVEWMRAGGGVWHTGGSLGDEPDKGLQLWIALPPEMEDTPPESRYLTADQTPSTGPARVVLGSYGDVQSSIAAPAGINYLDIRLSAGDRWTYNPPTGHNVGWIYVYQGHLDLPESVTDGELAVFNESEGAIQFWAAQDTRFVLGSAVKHDHDLVLGNYSVHTNRDSLIRAEAEIELIGRTVRIATHMK